MSRFGAGGVHERDRNSPDDDFLGRSLSSNLRAPSSSRVRPQWLCDRDLQDQLIVIGPAAEANGQPFARSRGLHVVSNPLMKATRSSSARLSEAFSDRLSTPGVVVLKPPSSNADPPWLHAGAIVAFRPPGADCSGNPFDSSCPGVLLYPPDSDDETQIRWAGGDVSNWIPIEHLHPPTAIETLAVEMLQECEPIVWMHTESFSIPAKCYVYVTWRNKHSRRVLCVSEASRVPAAFLILNDLYAEEGILAPGDGRCATVELSADATEAGLPDLADVLVRMRWPCGMESAAVRLASLDCSSEPELKAESDMWKAHDLQRTHGDAGSVLTSGEGHDVCCGILVALATMANWVSTFMACWHFVPDETALAAHMYFYVSLGLHIAVGCIFSAIFSFSRVKGMHIHPVAACAFSATAGMFGAASITFVVAMAASHAGASVSTETANAAWLRGVSLVATLPHVVLNSTVLFWIPEISGKANAFAVAAVVVSIVLDPKYGPAPRVATWCRVVRPYRRLLLVASFNNDPLMYSGGSTDTSSQVAVVFWNKRKVATLVPQQPYHENSKDCRQKSPRKTHWNKEVQVHLDTRQYTVCGTTRMQMMVSLKHAYCMFGSIAQLDDIQHDTNEQEISIPLRIELFSDISATVSLGAPRSHLTMSPPGDITGYMTMMRVACFLCAAIRLC